MILLRNKGFSLVEILVVIAIIGILAAIGIPQFSSYRTLSHNASAVSDLKNAIIAQEAYFAENRMYAGSLNRLILSHSLITSPSVDVIINRNANNYTISSHHISGNKTYSYTGPGGAITSK